MNGKTIYALGFFDGVHGGHQALLTACRRLACENGCGAGVVTFLDHPDTLVLGKTPPLINTPSDRKKLLLERFYMDTVVELPFDEAMRAMPWQDFFHLLVENYQATGLVCGHDFRFGYRGQGTPERLLEACREVGIPCVVVPEQKLDSVTISSTYIRTLIENGDMEAACRFLGHPHILSGTVISGRQLGRTLGIPTANLTLPEGVVTPRHGVYCCKAVTEKGTYLAVTNIGSRPTVGGHRVTVEPWILDFQGDLYGEELTLEFYRFLRPEKKFDRLEDLQSEIRKNALQVRTFFENT